MTHAGALLRLPAEMRVPEAAWLEHRGVADREGSRYERRAFFFLRAAAEAD